MKHAAKRGPARSCTGLFCPGRPASGGRRLRQRGVREACCEPGLLCASDLDVMFPSAVLWAILSALIIPILVQKSIHYLSSRQSFDHHITLSSDAIPGLAKYNLFDVSNTHKIVFAFIWFSLPPKLLSELF